MEENGLFKEADLETSSSEGKDGKWMEHVGDTRRD